MKKIHLNDAILLRGWIQRVLYIALADHTKVANDVYRGCSEHVVVGVGECLGGCHNNRITCVDSQGVKVLQNKSELE